MREPYIGKPQTRLRRTYDMIPATHVREHVTLLRAIGMTNYMIARAAGVSHSMVADVYQKPGKSIDRNHAAAITSVDGRPMKHQALVLGVGTNRRLQGLAVCGWSVMDLSVELGIAFQEVDRLRRAQRVSWTNYLRVKTAFERLGPDGGNAKTKRNALRAGFIHPLMWDDIDDPFAEPIEVVDSSLPDPVVVERLMSGRASAASREERKIAFHRLRDAGVAVVSAAELVGIDPRTAQRYSLARRKVAA